MKVTAERLTPPFIPIEVKLTFETDKEFCIFLSMLQMNISVPDAAFPKALYPDQHVMLKSLIDNIAGTMIVCRDKKRE